MEKAAGRRTDPEATAAILEQLCGPFREVYAWQGNRSDLRVQQRSDSAVCRNQDRAVSVFTQNLPSRRDGVWQRNHLGRRTGPPLPQSVLGRDPEPESAILEYGCNELSQTAVLPGALHAAAN